MTRTALVKLSAVLTAIGLGTAACASDPDPVEPLPPLVDPAGQEVIFGAPGNLVPGSGTGFETAEVFVDGMRFPLEAGPAYANSQVWGVGGMNGPPGDGQCDARNYSYPWRDNYCETRSRSMPLCPEGVGHQGQDIRPATCDASVHWAVAAESGQITGIGSYTVTLLADTGTIHRYLHMDMAQLAVGIGDTVVRGQRLGLVSNDFGGTPTTIHLHYDVRQAVELDTGEVIIAYVPVYTSLVESYEALLRSDDGDE